MSTLLNTSMAGRRVIARTGTEYTVDGNGAVVVTSAEDLQTFYLLGFVEVGVQTFYGTTASAANTYVATILGATPLRLGSVFFIKFTHAPTGAATLNINGSGAHPIVLATGAAIAGPQGVDGQMAQMVWDGISFVYPVQPNNS